MIEIDEQYLDFITENLYKIMKGEAMKKIVLPDKHQDNELKQVISYFNEFIDTYDEMQDFIYSISKGELDSNPPKGKLNILQATKNLQANLKHLTWKTKQISNGDFSQKVDFMGDFSEAFNNMVTKLKQSFEEIERQKKELAEKNRILEMSTPSIRLWEDIMILPVVGIVDSSRAQQILELTLNKISETSAKITILDIHGIAHIDVEVAEYFINIAKAIKLMGSQCIISGINPVISCRLVNLNINMKSIITKNTLMDALEVAFKMLNINVSKSKPGHHYH